MTATRPTHIAPTQGWADLRLGEVWQHRDLLWILALRDIKVRYKQTALGVSWVLLQPVLTMLVFSLFFGHLAGMQSRIEGGVPYPLYTLCALIPWQLFAQSMNAGSASLIESSNLISKVYFPRLLIPLASTLGALVDCLIALLLLLALLLFYGRIPTWSLLSLPLWLTLALLASLAASVWLSALSALYRDFRYTLGFLTQLGLFMTPIAYPVTLVPEQWFALYCLNPMVGVVESFRWALLAGQTPFPAAAVGISMALSLTMLLIGSGYFRTVERTLADRI